MFAHSAPKHHSFNRYLISMSTINNWLKIIHKSLYPPICLICQGPGQDKLDLCFHCSATLPYNLVYCKTCGVQLLESKDTRLCGKCIVKRPEYDSTFAMFLYEEPIRYLIRSLKFHSNHSSARLLGILMAEHLRSHESLPELIIPVPLHRNRFIERGFNQSIELARPITKALGIPMLLQNCERYRPTAPQSDLNSKERQKNLRDAFRITRPIEEKHVAIFDDVITTGFTVNELAKILRENGVEKIDVWSVARANLNG